MSKMRKKRQIAGENEGADFISEVGSHIRFKRKLFEDYKAEMKINRFKELRKQD